jgi:small-conductance mechanosensitive channel
MHFNAEVTDDGRDIPVYLVFLWCVLSAAAFAQGRAALPEAASADGGVPVIYRGQEVVRIYRGIGDLTAAERARLTSQRLNQIVRDPDFDPRRVVVNDRETYSELTYDDHVLGVITDEDAKASGQPRAAFARQVLNRLVEVIATTREEFSGWSIVVGLGWVALASGSLAALLTLLGRLRRRIHALVEASYQRLTDPGADAAAFHTTRVGSLVQGVVTIATAGLAVVLWALWVQVVLQVLPWSRPLARLIYRYSSDPIRTLWLGFLGIVPNLFYLAVIALIAFLALTVFRIVFREIGVGSIRLASFPDDWAEPTYKLVRALVLVLAFVGAFPYIPGSQSPAFQAIAIFLGLLVSVSSGSALSNIIAGTVLTYTRAFRLGDFVRIGETFGEVIVKRFLVTHVRTVKNEVVSIPNSLILTNQVINYTTLAAQRGLIVHTSVAIGYSAPWRTVHELLIAAALRTEGVLPDPPPFVFQTALNDYAITYEINAFVSTPSQLPRTHSVLHTNIQECFNAAGVEILSPNYLALRDGNRVTTPKQYRPSEVIKHPSRASSS